MTISVIIPAYNQGRYLGAAIQSVLAQSRQDFEIVVVDDGSTDDTRAVAQSFNEPRIRYVYQNNRGLAGARNTGIRQSRGGYLSFLDSDDRFLPTNLERLAGLLDRMPAVGFVAGQSVPVDDNDNQVGRIFDRPLPANPAQLLLGNPVAVGSMLIRREWQERVGYFDEDLRSYEDWDMWLRLARAGCVMHYLPEPVFLYRFHSAQMTRIGAQMTTATFAVLDKTFADKDLPASWRALKDCAYSRACLRAAAQAYLAKDYAQGVAYITQAVKLDASLGANEGELLARHFAAWIDLPKTRDPLGFIASVYAHLPPDMHRLRARRNSEVGRVAMQLAFEARARGDMETTRRAIRTAFRRDPRWLGNKGAVSILIRSHLKSLGVSTHA